MIATGYPPALEEDFILREVKSGFVKGAKDLPDRLKQLINNASFPDNPLGAVWDGISGVVTGTGEWITNPNPAGVLEGKLNDLATTTPDQLGEVLLDGTVGILAGKTAVLVGGKVARPGKNTEGGKDSFAKETGTSKPKIIDEYPGNLISTQIKSEMSGSQIKRLTKDMKANGFDLNKPIDVWRNPNTGRLEIQDGHHRVEAAMKAGLNKIPVKVWE